MPGLCKHGPLRVGIEVLVKRVLLVLVALMVAGLGWQVVQRVTSDSATAITGNGVQATPVEVGPVQRRPITLRRTFSGTLEAPAEFVVAPKVGGRVVRIAADLGDPVQQNSVVAELDDEEFVLAVAQAEADLAVAQANRQEAVFALELASRALRRIETLRQQGVASETEFDAAKSDDLAKRTQLDVATAQVTRAEAALQVAKVRLSYTKVRATWSGGHDAGVVASRFVNEGDTVGANAPLLSVVQLDPMNGIVFVAERDYTRLQVGQLAELATDGFPGETFAGVVQRIAPVFRQSTRQARVELTVDNTDGRLKPGMFIRATIELDHVANATVVPFAALTTRDEQAGVFQVQPDGDTVRWVAVTPGIREGDWLEVTNAELSGHVVTLGQQLCNDGGPISIPDWAAEQKSGQPLP